MKGDIRSRWGKLTDDDLQLIGGQKEKLVGRIQEHYGLEKDEAQRQVDEWHRNLDENKKASREDYRKAG
jgi:uncharacterized protein YjbJ (UPF0337 family)